MSWLGMTLLLVSTLGLFAWTARRRWRLLQVGGAESRWNALGQRVGLTLRYAIGQLRMYRYRGSGIAHIIVFAGFGALLLRSVVLWGRGYNEDFDLLLFGPTQPLGMIYAVVKDTFALLVMLGVAIFFYYRVIKKIPRLTRSSEGVIILFIIWIMMAADILYDGARMALRDDFHAVEYAGAAVGHLLVYLQCSPGVLRVLEHVGFWTHSSLVLIFLNLLPYSKHFHVITAIPNVFTMSLQPRGRLAPIEDMEGRIEREEPLGVATIDHYSWKGLLDLYTCTECGRCSDVCPATRTGKLLSPKEFTVQLRDHLYTRQDEAMGLNGDAALEPRPVVVEDIIKPEVLWACTTCRACEEECPVFITYVDKIVDLRRNLVMEQAEFPDELQNAFRGLETSGNPWSYPAEDRLQWTAGLDIPLISDQPDAEVLFWVGCAPAFDARARNVTIATAKLLKHAGVNFAILGPEETCTGDPARRAGNEFLFQMMAEQNCEMLNEYEIKKILTTCPHCFNTLLNEYPDFGGRFEVRHHTDYLFDLVRAGRLQPSHAVEATITYHDSCYLGRYNDIYDSPREILKRIPGVTLREPEATRDRGMCCGAGGAQMFKEEEAGDVRVNEERTGQLLKVLNNPSSDCASVVSSACPFCMRMLTDGLSGAEREDVQQLDVAEVLYRAVIPDQAAASEA
jgi:Fe-S oxidoreductase